LNFEICSKTLCNEIGSSASTCVIPYYATECLDELAGVIRLILSLVRASAIARAAVGAVKLWRE
jgi:hypothetical protein